ncbi:Uncharacterised protein, partial [Mycoplasmopsis synoviae]
MSVFSTLAILTSEVIFGFLGFCVSFFAKDFLALSDFGFSLLSRSFGLTFLATFSFSDFALETFLGFSSTTVATSFAFSSSETFSW